MDFDNNFDCGFDDIDYSFMDSEDFGLAKSFSTAPVGLLAPQVNIAGAQASDAEKECEQRMDNEIKADGFCFKLHPAEDQVQFQQDLKKLAPKMTDFAKGTTTLAFEF